MTGERNIVPESSRKVHPTPCTSRRAKRPSKAVRQRKKYTRRVTLNKFTAERIQKSLKIDIVEIDGVECDFADAFAFFTWYQDNYARLDNIPKPLALKFRDQYIALNVTPDEDEWLKEIIEHKYLFDDCYYEKLVNSDSDESVFDYKHKTDQVSVSDDLLAERPRSPSPTYRAESPVYTACNTTEYSGSSYEASSCSISVGVNRVLSDRFDAPPVTPPIMMDCDIPFHALNYGRGNSRVLYKDLGARRLCEKMTAADYDDINGRKSQLTRRADSSNVKIRYGGVTLYLEVDNIICYHKSGYDPILIVDSRSWTVRQEMFLLNPKIVVRARHEDIVKIVEVVAMG